MPLSSLPPSLLLRNAFVPQNGNGLMTQLLLFSDRLELRRFGIRLRVVPLSCVENVVVSNWSGDAVNLQIQIRGEEAIAGKVEAVLAWKYKLMELLGLNERDAGKAGQRFRLATAA